MAIWCPPARAAASLARSRWPRYIGMAIAARIPMMIITTSTSIMLKPDAERPAALGRRHWT